MVQRLSHGAFQKALWRILTNPTFEVVAAIVAVMLAVWVLVEAQADLRHDKHQDVPLLFGHK